MRYHLRTDTPQFFSDISEVVRLFEPTAEISPDGGDAVLLHRHEELQGGAIWRETWRIDGGEPLFHEAEAAHGGLLEKRLLKRAVKTGLFRLFARDRSEMPPWGSLTGIRPTRLVYEMLEEGLSLDEAVSRISELFFVSEHKARLLGEIVSVQKGLIEREDDEFDVYIGIPFCTTRCTYCSFSSGEIGDGRLVEPYLQALEREIRASAQITKDMGLRVRACYMGGGTPTSLSAEQLARVLDCAMECFPNAREWTVEAGRPDTIARDKLKALRERGIGRISVNPQTFSDETLARIGRAHTARDTLAAFALAREEGFSNINMDLIAALPGEDENAFLFSLEKALSLAPESITVHTLAIKRSSRLHEKKYAQSDATEAARMVDEARKRLTEAHYLPYYLYRQKYMAGNLENVGYSKEGCACLYNIDIMEETAPILALGAGAITKWLFPRELRIERAPNVKNIEEYIVRVDEMVERKRALLAKK
ncbi:MAG: coproporphyrinogen dehydrogenase HemZ [Christensenellales bacterium]